KGALQAARVGRITMDTLVLIGTWSAYFVGLWSLASGRGPAYFDSAAMIIVVVLFSRWLEALARQRSSGALSSLVGEDALSAWVVMPDGSVESKPVESVAAGDRVITRAGERITIDGVVREGYAVVDQSSLTGEPLPAEKLPGDEVWAGTIMVSGSLTIEVARSGEETLLTRMAVLVEDAVFAKTNLQRWADLVASFFGPVILAVAAAAALIGAFSGLPLSELGNRAVAVLVVACPCAVSLATPLVAANAISHLTSAGLVLRSASVLERAGSTAIIGMDKTGTLTQGEVTVVDTVFVANLANISPDLAALNPLEVASALEAEATHPLAKAIIRYAHELGVDRLVAREVQSLPGLGVIGKIDPGFTAMVGSSRLIEKEGIELPGSLLTRASVEEEKGHTVAWLAVNGIVIALLILADTVRPEAANVVKRLKAMDMQTVMVSGDAQGPCRAVASQIGIDDFWAEVLPHEKEQRIRELRDSQGRVAFAGDGINDAAALASSDLAIAFAPGVRMAAEAADIIVTDQAKNPLSTLPIIIQVARAARTIITQNLGWALMYNIVALPLAISGLLSPVWAAIAMAGSSLAVVVNSLRIRRYSVQK
ncbi:MAG TPA: cation-translocating P-type ATPase, partial [Anaerolineae bacterium]|nr:cation-translocating P-type ATPase [Anaerolineae bacterium]